MKINREKKYCFIVDSPLQGFNAVNFVFFHRESGNQYDLYVKEFYNGMQNIGSRIEKSGVFDNVYVFDDSSIRFNLLKRREAILLPKTAINKMIPNTEGFQLSDYDGIYISNTYFFSYLMCRAEKKADLFYIEDGVGSYLENTSLGKVTFKRKVIEFVFGGARKKPPKVLYVNNVEYCKSHMAEKIDYLIPERTDDLKYDKMIRKIFPCENEEIYRQKKLLYLTQPNDNKCPDYESINDIVIKELLNYQENLLIRKHPRDEDDRQGENVVRSGLWELICKDTITNDHVLIGAFSTAQLVPKLYYDKEPWLIFTINMYSNFCKSDAKKGIDCFIKKMKTIYSNPEKVLVVNKPEEFKAALVQAGRTCLIMDDNCKGKLV